MTLIKTWTVGDVKDIDLEFIKLLNCSIFVHQEYAWVEHFTTRSRMLTGTNVHIYTTTEQQEIMLKLKYSERLVLLEIKNEF